MRTMSILEYRITRQILRRREERRHALSSERLIMAVSVVVCLGALAALVPGVVWVMLLGSVVLTLGLN